MKTPTPNNYFPIFGHFISRFYGKFLQFISERLRKMTPLENIPAKLLNLFFDSAFIDWIKNRFQIFCINTSTHEFRFFIEKSYNKYEKAFWFVAVVICSCIAGLLLWYSLYLSSDTPTVTVVESTHYPTYRIPFPGVTVCNVNKISKKAINALARELRNPKYNATVEDNLEILKLLTGYIDLNTNYGDNFEELDALLAYNKLNIDDVMTRVMPKCFEMIEKCYWLGTEVRCDAFFQQTIAYLGACCSFNYIGVKNKKNSTTSPRVASSILEQVKIVTTSGQFAGLTVVLNPLSDDYFYSTFKTKGFRVIIHDSYNFPDINSPNIFAQDNYVSFIGIMPELTYSKDEIYTKEVKLRECYADDEINLNVMRRYSYINCMVECRRLIAYKFCECVPYNYPRNWTLPTCSAVQQRCIMSHIRKLRSFEENS